MFFGQLQNIEGALDKRSDDFAFRICCPCDMRRSCVKYPAYPLNGWLELFWVEHISLKKFNAQRMKKPGLGNIRNIAHSRAHLVAVSEKAHNGVVANVPVSSRDQDFLIVWFSKRHHLHF